MPNLITQILLALPKQATQFRPMILLILCRRNMRRRRSLSYARSTLRQGFVLMIRNVNLHMVVMNFGKTIKLTQNIRQNNAAVSKVITFACMEIDAILFIQLKLIIILIILINSLLILTL